MSPRVPIPHVLVPVFPQVGNMVSVVGGDDELWRAEVRSVDHMHKIVRGFFFVKHHHWGENQLWKRESMSHAMDIIHFKSIVGIIEGQWQGGLLDRQPLDRDYFVTFAICGKNPLLYCWYVFNLPNCI